MANTCYYIAKAIGSKEAVEEFARLLAREGEFENDGLGRAFGFEAEPAQKTEAKDIWTIEGQGGCDWSLLVGMMAEGLDRGHAVRSLESETARLHIAVELYSAETGVGFQEHVAIVDGRVLENECVDYEEYFVEELEYDGVLGEVAESLGVTPEHMRENVNHNGDYIVGGFGEAFGSFKEISKIERDYVFLRDMDSLREGKVQVCSQPDGSMSFFFGDSSVNGAVVFYQYGEEKGFMLTELSGNWVAYGKQGDLSDCKLRLYAMEVAKHVPVEKVQHALTRDQDKPLDEAKTEAKARATERNVEIPDPSAPRKGSRGKDPER